MMLHLKCLRCADYVERKCSGLDREPGGCFVPIEPPSETDLTEHAELTGEVCGAMVDGALAPEFCELEGGQ